VETKNLHANVDRNYVVLVFENLLSNAIKFSPEGKNIYVNLYEKKGKVRIEIMDEGPGISEQDIQKLFGKYQREASQPSGEVKQESIGLSIVKKYVEAQNGKVWCVSEPGKGATLIVEFEKYNN